ncbi:MAG: CDP-alcohol phosphatidyltransferase family protein [Hyphomicrobiaceae bacterium]|nr:MAG: CDP-alcohol phosphatidyltransferase family protein [Hyphomicrobiaceae bacterium]
MPNSQPAAGGAGAWSEQGRSQVVGLGVSIPNLISIGRGLSAPVIVWLIIRGQLEAAFAIFLVAGLSDAADGWLAKRYAWTSELGAYLDPLADKLLLVSIFIALGVKGLLPSWLVMAGVSRDLLIVIGVMLSWLMGHPLAMRPLLISKLNTLAQIVLVAVVLADAALKLSLGQAVEALVWLTAALTVLSLLAYVLGWLRHMTGYDSSVEPAKENAPPAPETRPHAIDISGARKSM